MPRREHGELARLRRTYLEQAERLDRSIDQYNAAIPRELWHLERPRKSAADAARAFDANCRRETRSIA